MTDVIKLHKQPVQTDLVRGLRNLADKLEANGGAGIGEDMPVITTMVVLAGHTVVTHLPEGDLAHEVFWELWSWGPRCDAFTVRGLMATVLKGH